MLLKNAVKLLRFFTADSHLSVSLKRAAAKASKVSKAMKTFIVKEFSRISETTGESKRHGEAQNGPTLKGHPINLNREVDLLNCLLRQRR